MTKTARDTVTKVLQRVRCILGKHDWVTFGAAPYWYCENRRCNVRRKEL